MSTRLVKRHGNDILKIIETVRQLPKDQLPEQPRVERRSRNTISNRLIKDLKAWRKETAAGYELNPGTLINNSVLEEITRRKPSTLNALEKVPGIKKWHLEEVGRDIIGLVNQHLAK
jgi:ribonuclease D